MRKSVRDDGYKSTAKKMHDKAGKALSTRASIVSSTQGMEQDEFDRIFPNGLKRKELNEGDKAGGEAGQPGIENLV